MVAELLSVDRGMAQAISEGAELEALEALEALAARAGFRPMIGRWRGR